MTNEENFQKLVDFLKNFYGTKIVKKSTQIWNDIKNCPEAKLWFDKSENFSSGKFWTQTFYIKWLPKFKIIKEVEGVKLNTRCYQFVEDNEVIKEYFWYLFNPTEKVKTNLGRKTDKYYMQEEEKVNFRTAVKLFWNFVNPEEEMEFIRSEEEENAAKMNFYLKDGSNKVDDMKLNTYINFYIIKKEFDFNITEKTYFLSSFLETEEMRQFFFETMIKKEWNKEEYEATMKKAEETEINVEPAEDDEEDED